MKFWAQTSTRHSVLEGILWRANLERATESLTKKSSTMPPKWLTLSLFMEQLGFSNLDFPLRVRDWRVYYGYKIDGVSWECQRVQAKISQNGPKIQYFSPKNTFFMVFKPPISIFHGPSRVFKYILVLYSNGDLMMSKFLRAASQSEKWPCRF